MAHTTTSITEVVDTTVYNSWYLSVVSIAAMTTATTTRFVAVTTSAAVASPVEASIAPFAPFGPLLEPLEVAWLDRSQSP